MTLGRARLVSIGIICFLTISHLSPGDHRQALHFEQRRASVQRPHIEGFPCRSTHDEYLPMHHGMPMILFSFFCLTSDNYNRTDTATIAKFQQGR
jgi:hypothetical protein